MSGLAATLREAEPGTRIRLLLANGREVAGSLGGVRDDSVDLDGERVALSEVKRIRIEYGPGSRRILQKRAA